MVVYENLIYGALVTVSSGSIEESSGAFYFIFGAGRETL